MASPYTFADPRLAKLDGFAPYPDGLIRLQGMTLRP